MAMTQEQKDDYMRYMAARWYSEEFLPKQEDKESLLKAKDLDFLALNVIQKVDTFKSWLKSSTG